ncbi:type II toxin-antitoxin system PrlF family antitoxin [Roseovarius nitratireducens]|uniref:type II toxin-antitoxin system PrlF family antitoxin n=1 Tax=Roseovarius nitratireducens TaxID=2044597 RepID=UPI000CE274E1|nr:type II toxin-antitoxin system PrlF family antitoxin [Roseovarius nitratireducens]
MSDVQAPRFEATLTDKYQNTVPAAVRKVLDLRKRDKVAYVIRGGQVILEKAEPEDSQVDPVVQAFLGFLEREMVTNPQRLKAFGGETTRRAAELTDGVEVDLDAPLDDE